MKQKSICKICGKEFKKYKYKSETLSDLYCRECRDFCYDCGVELTDRSLGFECRCDKCSEIAYKKYMLD